MLEKLNVMSIFKIPSIASLKLNFIKIDKKLYGLLLAMIGFFIAVFGGIIGFLGFLRIGYGGVVIGGFMGIFGIVLNFIINADDIFSGGK
jgi:hypothetical protein